MKQKLIIDYFQKKPKDTNDEKIYGYNPKTESFHCLKCGIDMGKCNPRQLCRKTYCDGN